MDYWVIDNTNRGIEYKVEDKGGYLEATPSVDPLTEIVFTNKYVPPFKAYNDNHTLGQAVEVGEKISYKINATNYNVWAAKIEFSDTLSKGLKIDPSSFKLDGKEVDPNKIDILGDDSQEGGTTFIYKTERDVQFGVSTTLEYTASVTKHAATKYMVENKAAVLIDIDRDPKPKYELDPLTNTVPVKEYGDQHKEGDVVHVGDEIQYNIKTINQTGDVAFVTFKDELSKGLTYNADSFKIKIGDEDYKDIKPEFSGNSFTYKQEDVADKAELVLSYTATVNEDALVTMKVNNSAKAGINSDPTTNAGSLTNQVDKQPASDGQTSQTNDSNFILIILLLAIVVVSSVITIVAFKRKRNKRLK